MTDGSAFTGSALSVEQVAYLIEVGEFTQEELADAQARIARGELAAEERATRQQAIADSLDSSAVGALMGIDAKEVDHRRVNGALFAFDVDDEFLYPTWQFTDDPQRPVLRGLESLIRALPADWSPAGTRAFMATPQRSARIDGVPVTPVEWLLRGGDPQTLSDILDSFLQS